jgi:hypothetical protein
MHQRESGPGPPSERGIGDIVKMQMTDNDHRKVGYFGAALTEAQECALASLSATNHGVQGEVSKNNHPIRHLPQTLRIWGFAVA